MFLEVKFNDSKFFKSVFLGVLNGVIEDCTKFFYLKFSEIFLSLRRLSS